jgi:predicted Fe-Mo cluster-binding NifX family protein
VRLAVAAEGPDLEAAPSTVFGRAPWLLIVDTGTESFEAKENAPDGSPSGAGIRAGRTLLAAGVDAVLAARVGPKAHEVLAAAGVPVLVVQGRTVREAVERFRQGSLLLLPAPPVRRGADPS